MQPFPLLTRLEQVEEIMQQSKEQPVLLLKHSTQCPISAQALDEVQSYSQTKAADSVHIVMVHVIEDRPVSNQLEEILGVQHQSPQAFWIHNEQVHWHASHREITQDVLQKTQSELP